jgi:hypothetical protein
MHGIMEKMLGSLNTCPRGLLRRRRWNIRVRVINFFFMVKFPELLGSTSYRSLDLLFSYDKCYYAFFAWSHIYEVSI